jgi:hypothetical protein
MPACRQPQEAVAAKDFGCRVTGADAARQGYRKCSVTCAQICNARPGLCLEPHGEALHLTRRRAVNKRQVRQTGDRENADAEERQQPKNDPPSQSTRHGVIHQRGGTVQR